ncbi:hypothetical protein MMC07_000970 [Pseudocyphellaria aurata]|nr:hypothetical protein [Pseudocyphellaria aurata]
MDDQAFLDSYPPSPASSQAPQDPSCWPQMHSRQGNQYDDIRYHQDPARFHNTQQGPSLSGQEGFASLATARSQGHPYPGREQGLYHQAVRGFPRSWSPHSAGPGGHSQNTIISTFQQSFTGQHIRQYTPQSPSHGLPHSSLGDPERVIVENHPLLLLRTAGVAPLTLPDPSPCLASQPNQDPLYHANSHKRGCAEDHEEEALEPASKRRKIQPELPEIFQSPRQTQKWQLARTGAPECGTSSNSPGSRHLLTAEEVAPMTFWLRRAIMPRDVEPSSQPPVAAFVVPAALQSLWPGLTVTQYAELVQPITEEEIHEWLMMLPYDL